MLDFTYLAAGLIQYFGTVSSKRAQRCDQHLKTYQLKYQEELCGSLMNCCHIDYSALVYTRASQSTVSCLILYLTSVRRKLVFYWAES